MQVTISEAKAQFTDLLKRVEAGETVIVTRRGKPIVRFESVLKPEGGRLEAGVRHLSRPRNDSRLGALKGQIWMSDDFDAPLEDFDSYTK